MGFITTFLNIFWWFPSLGFITAFFLIIVGFLFTITIVMAPFGLGLIELGKFYLAPFSHSIISEKDIKKKRNSIIWEILSIILFILYLPIGLIICCLLLVNIVLECITIIGIPMAIPMFKSLGAILNPIGKVCVTNDVKEIIDKKKAKQQYKELVGDSSSEYSSPYSSRSPSPLPSRYKESKKHKKHKKSH